ncbi:MAG TPA: YkvA family protein [Elainellaceae cyanobacterium]|jgi:uncharacterized membrane protein YkvA (DUF1232 family)
MKSSNVVQAFYNWYRGAIRNARYRWIIVLATIAYLVSPFDISPDFIPIIGWIDDGVIATLLVAELSQMFLEWIGRRNSGDVAQAEPDVSEPNVLTVDAAAE